MFLLAIENCYFLKKNDLLLFSRISKEELVSVELGELDVAVKSDSSSTKTDFLSASCSKFFY